MIVYRLCKSKYANDISGTGAKRAGGRWNSKGMAMLYTSQTISLCALEVAVHVPLHMVPKDYTLLTLEIPNQLKQIDVDPKRLPLNWSVNLHGYITQEIGDQFLEDCKSLVLKVPSAAVQSEYNYLINPHHPDFSMIKVMAKESFRFDKRLFVR